MKNYYNIGYHYVADKKKKLRWKWFPSISPQNFVF